MFLTVPFVTLAMFALRFFPKHVRLRSDGRTDGYYPFGFGKAAIIIHEIVLREAIEFRQQKRFCESAIFSFLYFFRQL